MVSIHKSECDCNAKSPERDVGAWRTSEFDDSGTASGISRSRLNVGPDHVVDGLDGTTLCMGCKKILSDGNQENALSFYPEQGLHWRSCGEVCLGRNHSEDGAKLNMRWMRGVLVGKLDRTDEFLLLTPTGAMKTRCVRRVEGDNAWDLQFFNVCVLAVRGMRQQGARSRDQKSNKRMTWRVANVPKILYLRQNMLDKYGRTAGYPGCAGIGQHTEECRARIEQEMVEKGDAIKLETSGNQEEIVQEPEVSLVKRTIGEPDLNPGGASSSTADTPKEERI